MMQDQEAEMGDENQEMGDFMKSYTSPEEVAGINARGPKTLGERAKVQSMKDMK